MLAEIFDVHPLLKYSPIIATFRCMKNEPPRPNLPNDVDSWESLAENLFGIEFGIMPNAGEIIPPEELSVEIAKVEELPAEVVKVSEEPPAPQDTSDAAEQNPADVCETSDVPQVVEELTPAETGVAEAGEIGDSIVGELGGIGVSSRSISGYHSDKA